MEMKLVYLCIHIAEGITAWSYFAALYKRKYDLWMSIAAYTIGYGVAFAVFNYAHVWVNTSLFALINFFLLYGLHVCSWKASLFHAGILTCLSTGLEVVMALLLGELFGSFGMYQQSTHVLLIMAICSKLLYFVATKLCLRIAKSYGHIKQETGPAVFLLFGFSLASIFVLLTITYASLTIDFPRHIENLMVISSLLLLFANILIFAGYQWTQKVNQENLSLQLVRQKDEAEETYFRALEEKYDDQRVIIHDIRRHLTAIKALAQEQGAASVVDYVGKIEDLPVLQNKVRYCDNPMLNVVLSRYGELCHEKGISFQVDVRAKEYDFLSPNDITTLFGNLLENAVEAAQDAAKPYVALRVDTPAGTALFISLTNSCGQPPQEDSHGGYLTRKLNKEQHCIGLKSVDRLVKRYGGSIKYDYDRETKLFHTSVMLKNGD